MIDTTNTARDYMMYGTGWGILSYNGETIPNVKRLADSWQPPLGEATTVQDINHVRPEAIITPLAITKGTLDLEVYMLNNVNFFSSIFNGVYKNAEDLADLFRQQLINGPLTFSYNIMTADASIARTITYHGLVVTNALRSFTIDAQSGQEQATCKVTCEYCSTTTSNTNWSALNNIQTINY